MLTLVIVLPLLFGTTACAWAGARFGKRAAAVSAAAVAILALGLLLTQAAPIWAGGAVAEAAQWVPSLGLNWQLRADALSLFFATLILAIGLLVITYASYYLGPTDPPGKFYATLMLFMAAMLGIVLADNLLLLVVFWELTSLSSFLLVGYWNEQTQARRGARQALIVTGVGGVVLAAGALLLGEIGGTHQISALLAQGGALQNHPLFSWALVMVLIGAVTKSAQFPFHFWLPDAMAAPTPVSAYLHSATMVKAGLFLLLRLHPLFAGSSLFEMIALPVGLATLTLGAVIAIFKHDLKGLLAYSTISHLGLIMTMIGLGTVEGVVVAVFHIFNHALFKAALFMSAGIVDHETGSRDLRHVNGMMRYLPWTGLFAIIAAAAMAGIPFFNGFLSKELFFTATLTAPHPLVPILATAAAAASVAYSFRFIHDTFFNGEPGPLPNPHPHEPAWGMRAPVVLLALLCVLFGVMPWLAEPLITRVAEATAGSAVPELHLALWHYPGLHVAMSGLALVGGGIAYALLMTNRFLHRLDIDRLFGRRAGRWLFAAAIARLVRAAAWITRRTDTGSLTVIVALVWMSALALLYFTVPWPKTVNTPAVPEPSFATLLVAFPLWLLVALSAGALLFWHARRTVAVLLTGVIGLVSAVAFALLSAPDLAMTQIAVEVVSTVLLFLALSFLPKRTPALPFRRRFLRGAIAVAAGVTVGVLAWWLLVTPRESISWYFLAEALPGGGGRNVVNVILVDFRGYDTFGEITVLGVAALGAWALFVGASRAQDRARRTPQWIEPHSHLLRVATTVMLPAALLLSIYLFLRGHNQPGGGFIAGLVTAAALLLVYLAHGFAAANQFVRAQDGWRFARTVGAGIAIAAATGAAAWAFGRPFLTSAHGHPHLPLLGELPLASAALFDLGVYVTVVGATLLLLATLAAGRRNDRKTEEIER